MRSMRQWVGTSLTFGLLLVASGCGDGKPAVDSSTTAEGKVSGTVKIRGKAMKGGEITFNPANYQRKDAQPRTARIKEDGTYEITTLVGQNTVNVTGPEIIKEEELGYAALSVEVSSGNNAPFNIDLPPKE